MVEDHVVEESKGNDEILLWGVDFSLFDEDEGGLVRERLSEYPYLLMLMNPCPGDW